MGKVLDGNGQNSKTVSSESMLNEAFLKEAEVNPLVCDKCGGSKFVLHEVVEAVSVKIPRNIGNKKNKEKNDISHRDRKSVV